MKMPLCRYNVAFATRAQHLGAALLSRLSCAMVGEKFNQKSGIQMKTRPMRGRALVIQADVRDQEERPALSSAAPMSVVGP
jgi:hypothetical protein